MSLTKVKAGNILLTTPAASSNDVTPATTQYVTTALANLADSAPSTLNTLNELAAALGDDANFSTTVTNSIATKLPLAGGTLTGNLIGTQAFFSPNTAGKNTITLTTNASDDGRILIKSNTTDKVDIQANGASYFNGGNVGIGTNNPSAKLHIHETVATGTGIMLTNTANTSGTYSDIRWQYSLTDTSYASGIRFKQLNTTHGGQLEFYTDNSVGTYTQQMTITEDGNVGIGEGSPSTSLHVSKGTNGSGLIDVARFENQGTTVNDGARIQLTAGASTSGAGIGCLGDALNSAHLVFHSGGNTERMRITSSGNVTIGDGASNIDIGIGNTGTVGHLGRTGSGALIHLGGDDCQVRLANSILHHDNSGNTNLYIRNHYTTLGNDNNAKVTLEAGTLVFATSTAYTERMRVASNGDIHFKCGSSQPSASVVGWEYHDTASAYPWVKQSVGGTGGLTHYQFYNPNGAVGQIFTSGSSTTYSASSDYRLKENVEYTWDATTLLKQLKPCKFNFIKEEDGAKPTLQGFLAHEVSNIVPGAVRYTKDAVDSEGEPEYQQMDPAKLVPLLVKTIQELEARITTLEG